MRAADKPRPFPKMPGGSLPAGLDAGLPAKWARLQGILEQIGSVAVAFSGGVDSALLCAAANQALAGRMLAITIRSPVETPGDPAAAASLAQQIGFAHCEIRWNDLDDPTFAANPPDRCYHCKLRRLRAIREAARQAGFEQVADGSNLSDAGDYRPGMRALAELGVRSPLAEAGLDKSDVRALARALGLPVWARPSAPCLATRFPYGTTITLEAVQRVAEAEAYLHSLGCQPVRVRCYGSMACLEVRPALLPSLVAQRSRIVERLGELGFTHIALDLAGYRQGSLNEALETASKDIDAPAGRGPDG